MRLVYRVAYVGLAVWSFLVHPRTRGVKFILDDGAGHVIFVRHTYGPRGNWELPGGHVHKGEADDEAARREAHEELGRDIGGWTPLTDADGHWHGKREHVACFGARWPGGPVRYDRVEIATVGWFSLDRPPAPLGPSTLAVLPSLQARA